VEGVVVTWRELMIVIAVAMGVYAAELMLLLRWSKFHGHRSWFGIFDDSSGAPKLPCMDLELLELRKQLSDLAGEVEKLRSGDSRASSPYNHAIELARQGATASDVAAECGISKGEAELIVALYRKLRI